MKHGLEADRTVIDVDGDRQAGYTYPKSVLVNITDTVRMLVSETFVPNDAKGLAGQVVDLPTCQVTYLSGSSRMKTGLASFSVGSGGRSMCCSWHNRY
jgi:hypothetical protein